LRVAGYVDTKRALARQAWLDEFGVLDGVILHEPEPERDPAAEVQGDDPQLLQQQPHTLAAE